MNLQQKRRSAQPIHVDQNGTPEDEFEKYPTAIITTSGRVFYCSNDLIHLLGYRTSNEVENLHFFDLISNDDIQHAVDAMLRILRPNGISELSVTLHLERRDGVLLTSRARIRRIVGTGGMTGVQLTFQMSNFDR